MAALGNGAARTGVVLLAILVAMAMVFSACHAQDYCHDIVPCDVGTCHSYCDKNNYKNYQPVCKQFGGQWPNYDKCCCQPAAA